MTHRTLALAFVGALAITGCAHGGHSGSGRSSSGYTVESSGRPTSTRGDYRPRVASRYKAPARGRSVVPPPAPSGGGAYEAPRRYQPAPRKRIVVRRPVDRPGLGTRFGERVRSRVNFTAFHRATARPTGMVSIHYNDQRGLQAMARYLRRRCCGAIPAYRVRAGITVQLVDAYRRPLSGLQVSGRTIVLGRHNQRYGILVRNNTPRRWEIVASVDGLDVIDGRRATVHKRGYILAPYGKLFIQGYRTSHATVAAFRFGAVRNSYVKRTTGTSRNVGVVGVAAFAEYVPRHSTYEVERRLRASPFAKPPVY